MSQRAARPMLAALPPEVQAAHGAGWDSYRGFPVFSRPWLLGRTRVFATVLAAIGALIGVAFGVVQQSVAAGVAVGLLQFAGFTLIASVGPALATWVRHRGWPGQRERVGVSMAILAGVLASGVIDWTASSLIAQLAAATESLAPQPALPAGAALAVRAINLVVLTIVYALLGGGLALRAYFSEQRRLAAWRRRQELEQARQQARDGALRLGVLQAQVEPHFLFNTLASIRALMRRDPDRAERTLDALVAHLRASIPRLRDGQEALHSTLGQQLDLCSGYLEVMRLRTGGRLAWTLEVPAELRALPYPPLLLITLVENAVKHGIEPKRGPGEVRISARAEDGMLRVTVADDGVGLAAGHGSGVGLANIRGQLQARYGAAASLRLQAREGGGACAEIRTPLEAKPT